MNTIITITVGSIIVHMGDDWFSDGGFHQQQSGHTIYHDKAYIVESSTMTVIGMGFPYKKK